MHSSKGVQGVCGFNCSGEDVVCYGAVSVGDVTFSNASISMLTLLKNP